MPRIIKIILAAIFVGLLIYILRFSEASWLIPFGVFGATIAVIARLPIELNYGKSLELPTSTIEELQNLKTALKDIIVTLNLLQKFDDEDQKVIDNCTQNAGNNFQLVSERILQFTPKPPKAPKIKYSSKPLSEYDDKTDKYENNDPLNKLLYDYEDEIVTLIDTFPEQITSLRLYYLRYFKHPFYFYNILKNFATILEKYQYYIGNRNLTKSDTITWENDKQQCETLLPQYCDKLKLIANDDKDENGSSISVNIFSELFKKYLQAFVDLHSIAERKLKVPIPNELINSLKVDVCKCVITSANLIEETFQQIGIIIESPPEKPAKVIKCKTRHKTPLSTNKIHQRLRSKTKSDSKTIDHEKSTEVFAVTQAEIPKTIPLPLATIAEAVTAPEEPKPEKLPAPPDLYFDPNFTPKFRKSVEQRLLLGRTIIFSLTTNSRHAFIYGDFCLQYLSTLNSKLTPGITLCDLSIITDAPIQEIPAIVAKILQRKTCATGKMKSLHLGKEEIVYPIEAKIYVVNKLVIYSQNVVNIICAPSDYFELNSAGIHVPITLENRLQQRQILLYFDENGKVIIVYPAGIRTDILTQPFDLPSATDIEDRITKLKKDITEIFAIIRSVVNYKNGIAPELEDALKKALVDISRDKSTLQSYMQNPKFFFAISETFKNPLLFAETWQKFIDYWILDCFYDFNKANEYFKKAGIDFYELIKKYIIDLKKSTQADADLRLHGYLLVPKLLLNIYKDKSLTTTNIEQTLSKNLFEIIQDSLPEEQPFLQLDKFQIALKTIVEQISPLVRKLFMNIKTDAPEQPETPLYHLPIKI